ncbi:MAG: ribosome recycling factor [Candidatus Hydrogenedentes bacterium]|nr:ribosome recycling factor [Candidatus Hydrogenedentota bacterium]
MTHPIVSEAKAKMEKSLEAFGQELSHIRTGRASVGMLDAIDVDAYGSKMKINQLANVTAPEPRLLLITPWDKNMMGAIEKAIMASSLDITPSNDGHVIRLPVPQLTEERRRDLVKMVGKMAEEAKIAVRNVRRSHVDDLKKAQKDGDIPEDEAHHLINDVQKLTDDYCIKIDHVFKKKDAQIMEVLDANERHAPSCPPQRLNADTTAERLG